MSERSRNQDGTWRLKRADTRVGTLEAQYGIDLEMRSDAHLITALERWEAGSVEELVRKAKRANKKKRSN